MLFAATEKFHAAVDGERIAVENWGTTHKTVALRWVGRQGDWDLLENLNPKVEAQAIQRPTDTLSDFANFKLQLAIPTGRTLNVLNTLHVYRDEAGLQTMILPGIPVYSTDGKWFLGHGHDDPMWANVKNNRTEIPASSVGNSFTTTSIEDHVASKSARYCTLDNGLLKDSEGCSRGMTEREAITYRVRQEGDKTIGLVKKEAGLYQEIVLKNTSSHAYDLSTLADSTAVMQRIYSDIADFNVKVGSPVFWMNGDPAGVVRSEHSLDKRQLFEKNGMRCTGIPWTAPNWETTSNESVEQILSRIGKQSQEQKPSTAEKKEEADPAAEGFDFSLCYRQQDLIKGKSGD